MDTAPAVQPAAADPAPKPGPPPDLKTLADTANEAAKREASIWFFFLTFGTFLAVAVGATTHRALLLEDPVRLPVFGVDLPLLGFYWVAPGLFVVLHLYALVQIGVLAGKVGAFLDAAERDAAGDRRLLRLHAQRLDSFPVVQVLAAQRLGERGWPLRAMAWLTLAIGPVVLLLFFQLRFLPYQDPLTTWVHRGLLALDLLLLVLFWPFGDAGRGWMVRATAGVGAAVLLSFSWLVATVPGEAAERAADALDAMSPVSGRLPQAGLPSGSRTPAVEPGTMSLALLTSPAPTLGPLGLLRGVLFDGAVDDATKRAASPFARRLVLPDVDLVPQDGAALDALQRSVVLRARNLRYAVLDRADLRKADLSHARLDGASLNGARLEGASLEHASLTLAAMWQARLDRASLRWAALGAVDAREASFAWADLRQAGLVDAWLMRASLVGVAFDEAALTLANLNFADLRGAELRGADLRAAFLDQADLRVARLDRGTRLDGAFFQAVRVWGADPGPDYSRADLSRSSAHLDPRPAAGMETLLAAAAPESASGALAQRLAEVRARVDRAEANRAVVAEWTATARAQRDAGEAVRSHLACDASEALEVRRAALALLPQASRENLAQRRAAGTCPGFPVAPQRSP